MICRMKLWENCTTFEDAIIKMITFYLIFDINFPKALIRVFQFLIYLLDISQKITNMTVKK